MEGNVPHDFLQPGDVNYDDLINNSGWPVASGDQYAFTPAPPPQPNYHQYTTSQPSFDQYQQPSYATQYSTSPYTSQYQQPGVSPDAFGSSSYSVEPSLQNPAIYHGSTGSFSFAPQEAPTIAPQSLQYHVPPSQPMHPGVSSPTFQQAMNSYTPMAQEQQQVFFNNAQSAPPVPQPTPAQYPAVQGGSMDYAPKPAVKRSREGEALSKLPPQTKAEPIRSQPRITNPELYASNSAPPGPKFKHAPFMALGGPLVPVPSSMKVPKYSQRKSKLEQDPIPGFDISRILTPTLSSSSKIRPPKEKKILVSKYKGTAKPPGDRLTNVRGENGSLSTSVKDTLSPTDSSSSDEESSSEEESGGEDEEMALADISTVREPTRPAGIADAARWDAIGIVWKDPKSIPSADVIKGAIEDYGAFVGALRAQLKANSTKIEEVEKDSAEATRLRQARTALLDSLYETINAANTLGYGAIVENLGGHEKLVHGLTTTLIECIKADDFLGRLPKAIFTLLARFQTMTEALLKRLRFDSIQKRWSKKGDDQIKKDISSILANTTEAKERASKASKDVTREEEGKKLQEKIELAKARKLDAVKHALNVTSTKRPHEGDPTTAKPNKKFALDTSANTTTAATKLAPPKKATNILANNLLGNTTKPAAKPLPKKREPSPPAESKLGALLASIAKPAEPPKAPEAPARPPETPEEKKRRERKESRRHLRVRFKDDSELEQIRLFKHELAEDEGRQDDMLRDAHDDRSEGMMHKKRVSEKLDENLEDDDALAGEIEERPYPNLVPIDFSELNKTTTFGSSYTTRGGDKTFSTPEQQIQERREALELMVIYTDPKDIPPSAKEPPQENRDTQPEAQLKRPNAPWIVNRLQEIDTYGPQYAAQIFFHRRAEARRVNDMQLASSQSGSSTNISSILQQLGGPKSSQKLSFTMDPSHLQNLTSIVEYLKSKPYPPTEPPQWMTNEAQRNDWWAGYRRDNTANGKQASTDLMAHMQVPRFEQRMLVPQMQQYQQQAPQPNMPSLPQATHDVAQQVQAYLSGLAASGNRGASSHQPYDFSALVSGHGLGHDSGKDSQHSRWDGEWENEVSRNGKQRGNDTKQWAGTHDNDSLFDENGEYKGKKKPCKFWSQGKCAKGAKCTFLHDEED